MAVAEIKESVQIKASVCYIIMHKTCHAMLNRKEIGKQRIDADRKNKKQYKVNN